MSLTVEVGSHPLNLDAARVATYSPVFKAHLKDVTQGKLTLKMSPAATFTLLTFLNTGFLPADFKFARCVSLMEAADYWQITQVAKENLDTAFSSYISIEDQETWTLAQRYHLEKVMERCLSHIATLSAQELRDLYAAYTSVSIKNKVINVALDRWIENKQPVDQIVYYGTIRDCKTLAHSQLGTLSTKRLRALLDCCIENLTYLSLNNVQLTCCLGLQDALLLKTLKFTNMPLLNMLRGLPTQLQLEEINLSGCAGLDSLSDLPFSFQLMKINLSGCNGIAYEEYRRLLKYPKLQEIVVSKSCPHLSSLKQLFSEKLLIT